LAAGLFLLYRGYFWLKFGHALEYSGLNFLGDADMRGVLRAVLGIEWQGVKKALLWLLSQPFEMNCLALMIVSGALFGALNDEDKKSLESFRKPEKPKMPQWLGRDV
jgi:hypothetical protein